MRVRQFDQTKDRGPATGPFMEPLENRQMLSSAHSNGYVVSNLVSNQAGLATFQDAQLVNPWGLASSPVGPWWVADNGRGVSTVYNSHGVTQASPAVVPPPAGGATVARPTGLVFNATNDFVIASPNGAAPAQFIFSTENGTISGWNNAVDANNAILAADLSSTGAVYKGLASGSVGANHFLYATDFHNAKVQVFDAHFAPITLAGGFVDQNMPAGFAPFGISNIGNKLYVSYALQDAGKRNEINAPGNGFVDVFTTSGSFIRRLASQGRLNSPWAMTMAPKDFGQFSNDLLIGNFGDGRINVYDPRSGVLRGVLKDRNRHTIVIPGLWALQFGNNHAAGPSRTLFFTAGPFPSLFGSIAAQKAAPRKGGHKPRPSGNPSTGGANGGSNGGPTGGSGGGGGFPY